SPAAPARANPGPGGWGWVVPDGPWAAGAAADTTNNRMELQAVLEALAALEGGDPLQVVTDSSYIVNCFSERWWVGWQRRGWRNARKAPVKNRDLWEPLIESVLARGVSFRWVKGHGGDPWNDAADRLATQAADTQTDRQGERYQAPPR
ncbi:MAG: ribonuclease HI, partial [Acidimicrobiia bacterium]|nr:ribonuclease HI [Acidimicrobiia bacterium]